MRIQISTSGSYTLGLLRQTCTACDWIDEKLRHELQSCPKCSKAVAAECSLRFGGIEVDYHPERNRFELRSNHRSGVEIAEADAPDILKFMLRHFKDWSGDIQRVDEVGDLRGKVGSAMERFKVTLDPKEYDGEVIEHFERMNRIFSREVTQLWDAVQQLVGFTQRQHLAKLDDVAHIADHALKLIDDGDMKHAKRVLTQLRHKLAQR
jgi:hypothetical protein